MTTSADIVNRSLEMGGTQTRIVSLTDGSPAATAANTIYAATVDLVMRQVNPDFARRFVSLSLSAGQEPGWVFTYIYPSDCVRLRQVLPPIGFDVFDPPIVLATVAYIQGVGKVILTNQPDARAVYSSNLADENQWDTAFAEAVERRLANPLAMALAGRPDFAKELLQEAMAMAQMSEFEDESGSRV